MTHNLPAALPQVEHNGERYRYDAQNPYAVACRLACVRPSPQEAAFLDIMDGLAPFDDEIDSLLGERRVLLAHMQAWVKLADEALDHHEAHWYINIFERHLTMRRNYREIMYRLQAVYAYLQKGHD